MSSATTNMNLFSAFCITTSRSELDEEGAAHFSAEVISKSKSEKRMLVRVSVPDDDLALHCIARMQGKKSVVFVEGCLEYNHQTGGPVSNDAFELIATQVISNPSLNSK